MVLAVGASGGAAAALAMRAVQEMSSGLRCAIPDADCPACACAIALVAPLLHSLFSFHTVRGITMDAQCCKWTSGSFLPHPNSAWERQRQGATGPVWMFDRREVLPVGMQGVRAMKAWGQRCRVGSVGGCRMGLPAVGSRSAAV